jgi:hypothetical protein
MTNDHPSIGSDAVNSETRKSARLLGLFLLGCVLFNFPVLSLFNLEVFIWNIPILFLYVFFGWGLFILLIYLAVR